MSFQALRRRTAKLEKVRKPLPSPIANLYGSWDCFADQVYQAVNAHKLDADFVDVLDILRAWEVDGILK